MRVVSRLVRAACLIAPTLTLLVGPMLQRARAGSVEVIELGTPAVPSAPAAASAFGWEYLDDLGGWHHTSTLKPGHLGAPNPRYDENAARRTHIPVP